MENSSKGVGRYFQHSNEKCKYNTRRSTEGKGLNYQPINVSIAAANIDQIRAAVKKARKDVEKVDNEIVNPFKIITSFPSIKQNINGDTGDIPLVSTIAKYPCRKISTGW